MKVANHCGCKRTSWVFILTSAFMVFCQSASQATVFWDDEMEAGNTGYNISGKSGTMTFDTSVKFSGNGSLRLDYPSECYPDKILQGFQCGGYVDRNFPQTSNLYRRFYINMASNFKTGDSGTKIIGTFPGGNTTFSTWWVFQFGSHVLSGIVSRAKDGVAVVYNQNGTFPFGQWVCVETHEQLNTPGQANGVYELWVNGTQVLSTRNVMFLVSGDNTTMGINRLYRQVGLGSLWFDRVAVGDSRIGCAGSPPPTPPASTPPAAPTGLIIQ